MKTSILTDSLGFDLRKQPIIYNGVAQDYEIIINDTVEKDNRKVIATVGKNYELVDANRFYQITNQISEVTGFKVQGYNTYNNDTFLAYLKTEREHLNIGIGGVEMKEYLVIKSRINRAFEVGSVSFLPRCQNQMGRIFRETSKNQIISIRHSKGTFNGRIEDLYINLETYKTNRDEFYKHIEVLNDIILTPEQIKGVFNQMANPESTKGHNIINGYFTALSQEHRAGDLYENSAATVMQAVTRANTHYRNYTITSPFGAIEGGAYKDNIKGLQLIQQAAGVPIIEL